MNKQVLVTMGLGTAIILGGMNAAVASDDKAKAKGLNAAVVEQANIINKLIDLGDARKDPILLLAAAKLQKTMSDTAAPTSTENNSTEDVLKRAKKAANGRKDVAGIADDIAAMKSKGRQYHYSNGYYTGTTYR
ncbi:hypothetical protein [Mariprofundus sp. KV]|uniref:hypothetical protein n=1 Tax=Mariprofundus sp. KV TaxID=2608715 RepID=UPI0015A14F0C|nr:hypothetical protein [Mariprofundus sp. KV]NWF35143.1 hypothetical protein [Mariprofundus sp. KV]